MSTSASIRPPYRRDGSAGADAFSEVHGEDAVRVQRGREAVELLLHVGVREALEVADQRLGAGVELLLEALDELLLEHAAAVPLAVGAAQPHLPVLEPRLLPLEREHARAGAARADVQAVADLGRGG